VKRENTPIHVSAASIVGAIDAVVVVGVGNLIGISHIAHLHVDIEHILCKSGAYK
jgi:hypothetical protein